MAFVDKRFEHLDLARAVSLLVAASGEHKTVSSKGTSYDNVNTGINDKEYSAVLDLFPRYDPKFNDPIWSPTEEELAILHPPPKPLDQLEEPVNNILIRPKTESLVELGQKQFKLSRHMTTTMLPPPIRIRSREPPRSWPSQETQFFNPVTYYQRMDISRNHHSRRSQGLRREIDRFSIEGSPDYRLLVLMPPVKEMQSYTEYSSFCTSYSTVQRTKTFTQTMRQKKYFYY